MLRPISRELTSIDKIGLWGTRLRNMVVFPTCCLWQTHENGFDSASRLETKDSPTVIDKVEFDYRGENENFA
jgi:hypothetical protein